MRRRINDGSGTSKAAPFRVVWSAPPAAEVIERARDILAEAAVSVEGERNVESGRLRESQ